VQMIAYSEGGGWLYRVLRKTIDIVVKNCLDRL